jgi:uncharacterized protein (DUF1697 family)
MPPTPSRYVALLRGINVGGKNKVEMSRLKVTFESAGSTDVRTYINSGNVVFAHRRKPATLTRLLEKAIATEFGFPVEVLLRDHAALAATAKAIPRAWKDDSTTRCYVMFLWDSVDTPDVIGDLIVKPGIDKVKYVPGAIIWRADRANLTRSGMMRLTSSELYRSMTIRNCNTVRKLDQLLARPT